MSYAVGAIQTAVVSVNASQFGNSWTTPITLVGAPGVGFIIVPLKLYVQVFAGSQMWANTDSLVCTLGLGPNAPVTSNDNIDVDATCYNIFQQPPYGNGFTAVFDFPKKDDSIYHQIGPLALTSVAASPTFTLTSVTNPAGGSAATYNGTITGGAGNAFSNWTFIITGFTNSANNGTFVCSASTATTLVLTNANAVAETHAASAASQVCVYTGTITGGDTSAYSVFGGGIQRSYSFTVAGFTNNANNGNFVCVASTATTLALMNANATTETHAATATATVGNNQPLTVTISSPVPQNPNTFGTIVTANIVAGNSGSGYTPGDTGDINDSGSGTFAHYTVNTVNGGTGIATFTLNSGGGNSPGAFGYGLNHAYDDINQSGGGSGAKFVPQTVTPGNGTFRFVTQFAVLPL